MKILEDFENSYSKQESRGMFNFDPTKKISLGINGNKKSSCSRKSFRFKEINSMSRI